jgi:hypothetical protein
MGMGSKIHQIAVHKEIPAVNLIARGISQIPNVVYNIRASIGPKRLNRILEDTVNEVFGDSSNVIWVFVVIMAVEQFCLLC